MKMRLISIAILAFAVNSGMAATTVLMPNINLAVPAKSLLITGATGTVYAGGSWGVGVFNSGTDFSGIASSVFSAFNQNGSTVAFAATAGVISALGAPGVTNAVCPITNTGIFVGNPIMVLVGNGATLAGSTDYIVVNSGVNWTAEVEGVGGSASAYLYNGTVLRGQSTVVNGATGAATQFNGKPGVTFGVIPEPSAALLGALGVLGLLRRRRI